MTLEQYIQQKHKSNDGGINENECKLIIHDILKDLCSLHKSGFIHCDLKPSHIMLRNNEINRDKNGWKIINYHHRYYMNGDKVKKSDEFNGSIEWNAPEVWPWPPGVYSDINAFNYGNDIWDIGLLILYILFGHQPFQLTEEELKGVPQCDLWKTWYQLRIYCYDHESDHNRGEILIRNFLISAYFNDKITKELFELLHDHILVFDYQKRWNVKQIMNHPWFQQPK